MIRLLWKAIGGWWPAVVVVVGLAWLVAMVNLLLVIAGRMS